ncbi:MAG: polyhydroxyalkanoate synthesis repressor PhaR [Pseudomonadota bacterium]|nr:polyhydroxyalkanoate synthesis repressor PhaR [Alteromonadaceae bacterium]MCP4862782.1 polyhydroxyalkanoate synthesis repressor PhaR [Alteromonas sp.]MDY6925683.1 polyhydroxyalkanoate synthesis repressor PhaR [Pseudomonadota bacterium]RPH14790.1 MAG: polyhydroxyalkanoate synthesis repressor PhaR [Alteromonadaceae bacterium TMED7]HCA76737.1 polyhydroxyalkanoate synthesis repressor PhaR [Alteromonas sp.]|tara:strand:+ start:2995 stop:3423 length:429 start_codon:yes stop_codon:yes gene_type:complete
MVTIKKYPNRRLYDTSRSQYVNMDYIKTLVNERTDFNVVDSKSGDDVTKTILLQIISESETNEHQSLLTNKLLKQLIRFYDSDMQLFLREYLEQSLISFMEQQDSLQGMMKNMVDTSPLGMFSKIMEQNIDAWTKSTKEQKK